MPSKRLVIIGLLGPMLDNGKGPQRWERWRPSVALCQHEDLLVSRFELLHEPKFAALYAQIAADILAVSPETQVRQHQVHFEDAWDFQGVYAGLHDFAKLHRESGAAQARVTRSLCPGVDIMRHDSTQD